jgi:hypothetical protein
MTLAGTGVATHRCTRELGSRRAGLFGGDGMAKELKPGDKVSWDSSGEHSVGKVVRTQTTPTRIKNHKVAASKDNPQYIVRSDKSGKEAVHKPSELKKA